MISSIPITIQREIEELILQQIQIQLQSNGRKLDIKDIAKQYKLDFNICKSIQWAEIDAIVCEQYKTYVKIINSHQRFINIIVPNQLPPYPRNVQHMIQQHISSQIRQIKPRYMPIERQDNIINMFTKGFLYNVNLKFQLKETDPFQFGKQQYKMICQVKTELQKVLLKTPLNHPNEVKNDLDQTELNAIPLEKSEIFDLK
ncbi:Hypothetical_protein [Hexamita inflata]|uniref:Hypothetical_protein n=1 Tax=Hexamita inflata TaxID=28002 RepID=A0AA86UCM2_9EUKA|nr:Hypothetical protein HINF_LOCUS33392 [Hexamita inflata]